VRPVRGANFGAAPTALVRPALEAGIRESRVLRSVKMLRKAPLLTKTRQTISRSAVLENMRPTRPQLPAFCVSLACMLLGLALPLVTPALRKNLPLTKEWRNGRVLVLFKTTVSVPHQCRIVVLVADVPRIPCHSWAGNVLAYEATS
jgi:hypothetical protein